MRATVLAVLACASLLAGEGVPFTVAYEDQPLPPWSMPDGSGSDLDRLRAAAPAAGLVLSLQVLPWRRCLAYLQEGRVDAVLNASFTEERAAWALYPRDAAGAPDPARSLHHLTYALYRRRGDALAWDGRAFSGLSGPLGAQTAFSIVARLQALGATVDDSSKEHAAILRRLAFGRLQGAALIADAADASLRDDAGLAAVIERVEPALETKPYYLIISPRFAAANPGAAERLWELFRR